MQTILIASAVESESNRILKNCPNNATVVPIGIGLVAASAQLASMLGSKPYKRVIFTGTCGIIDSDTTPIGSIVHINRVLLADISVLDEISYFPKTMTQEIALATEAENAITAITTLGITGSEKGRQLLKDRFGNVVENMEAFAVAAVCQKNNVPCEMILGVSNRIGSTAHSEWSDNHMKVSEATQDYLLHYLGS